MPRATPRAGGPGALWPLGCLGLWLGCSLSVLLLSALALAVTLSTMHTLHPGALHTLLEHLHLIS